MTSLRVLATATLALGVEAFTSTPPTTLKVFRRMRIENWSDGNSAENSDAWKQSNFDSTPEDWEATLQKKKDGSYWSDFEIADETSTSNAESDNETESKLDTLALLQAEEIAFNDREAQRADTVRQMQEWGFDDTTIASALDVSVEEATYDVVGMQGYREDAFLDVDDLRMVESHAKVPKDPATKEPIRSQMVYVDEHACIGCTNCAMIAQSTFFMEEENGRARVFEQWGDDETTVEIARQTCPVDCIHYVPYEELVQLEVRRRDQYINVLAGLVSRAERGAGSGLMSSTPRSFGSRSFTEQPQVSRGYDRGNPEFDAKEKARLLKDRRSRLEDERRRDNKIVDL